MPPREGRDALSPRSRARVAGKKKRLQEGPNKNVPAGAFGGEGDYRSEPPPEYAGQQLRYSETPEYLNRQLDLMSQLWREQLGVQGEYSPMAQAQALVYANDPTMYARKQYENRLGADPWGPGGQFEGRRAADLYTPEYLLASQGNTAENQIAQMGGHKGIDPAELAIMNRGIYNRRAYF